MISYQDILLEVLWKYGMRGAVLRAVQSLNPQSCVCVLGTKLNMFLVGVDRCQGCPLSPILDMILMVRKSRCSHGGESIQVGGLGFASLIFADPYELKQQIHCFILNFFQIDLNPV